MKTVVKDMTIGEVIRNNPNNAPKILFGFGLGCVGCPSAQAETIEEACLVHRLNVEDLVNALNVSV